MFLLIPNRIREIKEKGRREGFEEGRREGREERRGEAYVEAYEKGFKAGRESRRANSGETRSENSKLIAILIGLYDRGQITLDELVSLLESRSNGNRQSD